MRIRDFTLSDFETLYEEVKQDLCSYGFSQIKEIQHTLSLNLKGHRIFGKCKKTRPNSTLATIYLNKIYADSTTIERIKNTIMHELIHSMKNYSGHTGNWKKAAQIVTLKSKGKYEIKRLGTMCSEFKDTITREKGPLSVYKYTIICTTCKKEYHYKNQCKIIKEIKKGDCNRYTCPECKGKNFILKEVM